MSLVATGLTLSRGPRRLFAGLTFTLAWARAFSGTSGNIHNSEVFGVAVDGSGTYVTGNFSGKVDVTDDGVANYLTSDGGRNDMFVVKLDSGTGATDATFGGKRFGGKGFDGMNNTPGTVDRLGGVAVAGGFVYLTSNFRETVDFDPSATSPGMSTSSRPLPGRRAHHPATGSSSSCMRPRVATSTPGSSAAGTTT